VPNIHAELEGYKETRHLLTELPKRVVKKGLRAAVTAGAAPIQRQMKATAPRDWGILKSAIAKKVKSYRGAAVAVIGARKDVSATVRRALKKGDIRKANRATRAVPANYLHLVTGGTKPHMVGKWHHPGSPSKPFLQLAYHQQRAAAEAAAASKLKEVVEAEAKALGKA
jgi:hypothetical protein